MIKRPLLLAMTILLASPGVFAQGGVTDLFRSLTGALRGGREQAPQQQGVTATIGVRGMDEDDAKAAAAPAASEDYVMMEGWAATKGEAEALAAKKGLSARPASLATKETRDASAR